VIRLLPLILLALTLGCAAEKDDDGDDVQTEEEDDDGPGISLDDDDDEIVDEDGDGWDGCEVTELEINGDLPEDTPSPTVGDQWIVFLVCDGVKLQGANRLFFLPAELATVEDVNTIAVFLASGTGTMTMQSGNNRITIPVTVLEAEG